MMTFLGPSHYRPNNDSIRRSLWEEMAGLITWWDLPWCISGDFNVTHFPNERLGEARFCTNNSTMMEFSDFISKQGLV
jgi:hypothetical protein